MPDEISLATKRAAAFRALVRLFLWRGRGIIGVVAEVLMALKKLLLPEALITLVAVERLLVRVDKHVRLEMALRDRRVWTQVALEALFTLVRLLVYLECVPVREGFPAHLAVHRHIRGVQLLDVQPQVRLPAACGGAELTLEDRLVTGVDEAVGLQGVALRESRMADVTLIGLLPGMDAQVPL